MSTTMHAESSKIDGDKIQRELSKYQHPSNARSIWQLSSTLTLYILAWVVSYFALQYSFWLALPVMLINGGLLIRLFIIFHDCGHGSFFKSSKANNTWGNITGILTFTPYYYWRASHAKHHATSGNLDERGHGDVWMMTVAEYAKAPLKERIEYRLYRNPFIMFLLGPLFLALITNRFVRRKSKPRERYSVYWTNAGIVVIAFVMSMIMGWQNYLLIQIPTLFVALMCGVWLFYVQHQFEDVYWSREQGWDFVTASLEGGSFYDLPIVLRWFTGSIGYHHVHHLNSRIPNYYLAKCHENVPGVSTIKPVTLLSSLKSLTFRLWDEESGRLVGFRAVKAWRLKHGLSKAA